MATGRQLKMLNQPDTVSTMLSSRDGGSLLTGMRFKQGTYLWVLEGDESPAFLNAPGGIAALALGSAAQNQSILTFSQDACLRRWSATDHRIQSEVSLKSLLEPSDAPPGLIRPFHAATFFADGRKLAVVAPFSGMHIVHVDSGKETGRVSNADLVASSPTKNSLAITRKGPNTTLKRMSNDEMTFVHKSATVVLIDAETCREEHQIEVAGSDVWALAFSPDGKTLAATTGWETGQIHLYDVATGHEFRTIETPATRTPALAFSPDGSKLICGMADTSVLVWDLQAKP